MIDLIHDAFVLLALIAVAAFAIESSDRSGK